MAKTPKVPKKEEEYKFSEIDEEPILEPERPPRSRIPAILRNRRVLMILGIIVAVLIVYLFIGRTPKVEEEIAEFEKQAQPLTTTTTTTTAQQPTTTTQVTTTPLTSVTAPETTALPLVPPQAATTQPINVINGGVVAQPNGGVSQTNGGINQGINQNTQGQLQQIQTNLQQLQSSVTQLGTQVANLNTKVGAMPQCPIPSVPKAVTTVVTKPVVKIITIRPVYAVRAVVPGRAWLQVKVNRHIIHLITVKVGDFLPGYGRVQAINDRQGRVWTSWGNVINYDNGVTD